VGGGVSIQSRAQGTSTHFLWKDKVGDGVSIRLQAQRMTPRTNCGRTKWKMGSASHGRLKGREHTQAEDARSGRWGQHLIAGSKDQSTDKLRKDRVGGGVSIRWQAERMRAHTGCGRTKWEMGSASDRRLKDESTHGLWKDKVGGRVSIRSQAQRTRAHTS